MKNKKLLKSAQITIRKNTPPISLLLSKTFGKVTLTEAEAKKISTPETQALLSSKEELNNKLETMISANDAANILDLLDKDFVVKLLGSGQKNSVEPISGSDEVIDIIIHDKYFEVKKNALILVTDKDMLFNILTKARAQDQKNGTQLEKIICHGITRLSKEDRDKCDLQALLDEFYPAEKKLPVTLPPAVTEKYALDVTAALKAVFPKITIGPGVKMIDVTFDTHEEIVDDTNEKDDKVIQLLVTSTLTTIEENAENLSCKEIHATSDLTKEAKLATIETNALLSSEADLNNQLEALIAANDASKIFELLDKDFIVTLKGKRRDVIQEPINDGKEIVVSTVDSKLFAVEKNAFILATNKEMLFNILNKAKLQDQKNNGSLEKLIGHCITRLSEKDTHKIDVKAHLQEFYAPVTTQTRLNPVVETPSTNLLKSANNEWDKKYRLQLNTKFERLKNYVESNIPKSDPKYVKALQLCQAYQPLLTKENDLSSEEKKNMLLDLASEKTKTIFAKHRNLKFLIGEIVSFIVGLGVFYLIAASSNKTKTGHFGVFATPKTQLLVNEIERDASKRPSTISLK